MKNKITIFIMLVTLGVNAQSYKHFTIENGLPSNRIYKILQDNDGFIWIATDKGVAKFDGKHFKTFSTANGLPANDIWDMAVTNDHKLWYFTKANALGYILCDSIYKFQAKDKKTVFYPHIINHYQNEVGFVSYGKNYALSDNQWKGVSAISRKYFDKTHPKLQRKLKEENNSYLKKENNIEKPKGRLFLQQINDSLFVSYYTNKVLKFININTGKKHLIKNDTLFPDMVSVVATNDGIQISGNGFFAKLDKEYHLSDIQLFAKNYLANRIFQDKEGNYWISSSNKGVFYIPKNYFLVQRFFVDEQVRLIKKIDNKLYAVINYKGVYQYDTVQQKFVLKLPVKDYFYGISQKNKNTDLVFGRLTTYVLRENKIDSLFLGIKSLIAHNNVYYGKGIYRIYKYNKNLKQVDSISLENVNNLIDFKEKLIATNSLGLYQIINNMPKRILRENLNEKPILSLAKIKNILLIGTDGKGVYTWNGKDFEHLGSTQKMIVNDIFVQDNDVIISGQNGVYKFLYDNDNQLVFKSILQKYDGLISDQINSSVIFDKQLFSASTDGISAIPVSSSNTNLLSKIYIASATYASKTYKQLPNSYKYQNNNHLSLKYGIIDFKGQENHKVFYKLLPIQTDWLPTDTKQMTFNNLQPDKYSFQLKVKTPYQQQIDYQYDFKIRPLWWQTLPAKLFFGLLIFLLLFSVGYFYRMKKSQKRDLKLVTQKQMAEQELYALRSQMNPHFVFNSLNAIMYYINDENFEQSEIYLLKFSRLIRMIFDYSREKTIRLRDEITLLKSYLELEKMRFGDDFNYCFDIDNQVDMEKLALPTMLLQPLVENAVNHGIFHNDGKGTICLEINKLQNNIFQIRISDDGVGLAMSSEINQKSLKKHLSKSTKILQERINLLNISGQWKITFQLNDMINLDTKYNTEVNLTITKL